VTPHQIVALAIRLFAIWLGMQALGYVYWFLEMSGSQARGYVVYIALNSVLTVVIILVAWFFPRAIAGKLLPPQDEQSQPSATVDTWLAMGCTLIGLWTLTTTIPKLVNDVFVAIFIEYHDNALLMLVLRDVVQVAIAVWLVLGGKGVGKIFRWAQYAGIRKDL
jgi:hypothetical protein